MGEVERVLIVGGGIGGLTLAAALQRYGFDAEVVERHPEWQAAGAGLSVQPNGLRVLRQLGLDAAVMESGCVVRDLAFGRLEPAFTGQISWRSIAPLSLPGAPSIQFWLGDRTNR